MQLRQDMLIQGHGLLAPCPVSIVTAVCDRKERCIVAQSRRLEACRWILLHTLPRDKAAPGYLQETKQPSFLLNMFPLQINSRSGWYSVKWKCKVKNNIYNAISLLGEKTCLCMQRKNLKNRNKTANNDHFCAIGLRAGQWVLYSVKHFAPYIIFKN